MERNDYGFSVVFNCFYNFISIFPAGGKFDINRIRSIFKRKETCKKSYSIFLFSFPLPSLCSRTVSNE
jgi:hypothetical protein